MIEIKVQHDLDEMEARLSRVDRSKWPRILAYASTETGFYVRNKIYSEMKNSLDRPKSFTLNSLFVKKGNARDPEATVMWRPGSSSGNSAGRYLMPQVHGGTRQHKGFEKLLIHKGVMSPGYFLVPHKDAPDDGHGNVPGSYLVRIISFLRAFRDHHQNRNISKEKGARKKLQFFAIPPGVPNRAGLAPGIYERLSIFGGAIRQVFFFTRTTRYQTRFPFYEVAKKASDAKFMEKLDEGIKKAVDGSKGF